MNFRGLGAGSRILSSAEDYDLHHTAGHFWMTLLEGRHVSSDVALVDGVPKWWRHATGLATGEGMFDRWTVHAARRSRARGRLRRLDRQATSRASPAS